MTSKYGPWGIVAGGSDGVGEAFARGMAARGINVVLVARRVPVLEQTAASIRAAHRVDVRTVALDLAVPGAIAELERKTADIETGLFVYNAGSDDGTVAFLDKDLGEHLRLVQRNAVSAVEAAYAFGGPMAARGRGGLILVTSGAAWVGGATLATYGATKAFDLILAEGLWAEWHDAGVDVLALVLGRTDTPSLRRSFDVSDAGPGDLADPRDVAETALDHLADGPTWVYGGDDPGRASPLTRMPRREAVLAISQRIIPNDPS